MPSVVKAVRVASSTTNNTTVALSVISPVPSVGNLLTLVGRSSAVDLLVSVEDGVNRWSIRANGHDNAMFLADCIVAGDMTGATITCTLTANDANKIIWVHETAGVLQAAPFGAITPSVAPLFLGTFRYMSSNTLSPPVGSVLFGWWADSSLETSLTPASGYTNLPGLTGPGYANSSSSFVEGVYQLITAAGSYEPQATGGASPVGYAAFAAYYLPAAPQPPTLHGFGAC